MKKPAIIGFLILVLATFAFPAGKSIKLKVGFFSPADSVFQDIYGGGVKLGLEAGLDVAKNLRAWLGFDYFAKSGELAETKDTTDLWIYPISAGVDYKLGMAGPVAFYAGGGIEYVLFKEENILGTVNKGGIGVLARAGGEMKLRNNVFLDVSIGYSLCKMKNGEAEFKVGGLDLTAALAIKF
jgi:opacity protein-like surface antigen